jgi:hypothetical protein
MGRSHGWEAAAAAWMGRGGSRAEPPPADDAAGWITGLLPDDWFTGRPEVIIDRDEILIIGTLAEPAHAGSVDSASAGGASGGDAGAEGAGAEGAGAEGAGAEGASAEGAGAEGAPGPGTAGAGASAGAGAGAGAGGTDVDGAGDADRAAAEQGRIAGFREATRDSRIRLARQIEHRYRRKVAWGCTCGGTTRLFTTLSAPVMTRLRQPERRVLDTLVDAGVARSRSEALAWCVRLVGRHADQWLAELRDAMGTVDELRRRGPEL